MLPVIAQAKEVQTVEELIQMYDSTSCKAWHQKIYEEWGKSLHARPLIGPVGRTLATFKCCIQSRETDLKKSKEFANGMKEFLQPCVECHFPQLMNASEEVANQIAKAILNEDEKILKRPQITCAVCHNDIVNSFMQILLRASFSMVLMVSN